MRERNSKVRFLRTLALQVLKEKIDLENQLEQEQEYIMNRLQKQVESVEAEKRYDRDVSAVSASCKEPSHDRVGGPTGLAGPWK